jgi:hypothetical protein
MTRQLAGYLNGLGPLTAKGRSFKTPFVLSKVYAHAVHLGAPHATEAWSMELDETARHALPRPHPPIERMLRCPPTGNADEVIE